MSHDTIFRGVILSYLIFIVYKIQKITSEFFLNIFCE